jgi:hypothetical protein
MKGGIAIRADGNDDNDPEGAFTAACRVSKDNEDLSNDYLLTCNHGFFDGDICQSSSGEKVYYADGSTYGEVYEYNEDQDWALIEPYYESDIDAHIIDSRWDYPVSTNKTRNGLKDMMSNDTTVERVGVNSGEIQGTIQEIDYNYHPYTCLELTDGVKTNTGGVRGDSGGPVYTKSCCSDILSMVSIHTTSPGDHVFYDCHDNSVTYYNIGSPCYKMNNDEIIFHG